jgi:hypothetical protein
VLGNLLSPLSEVTKTKSDADNLWLVGVALNRHERGVYFYNNEIPQAGIVKIKNTDNLPSLNDARIKFTMQLLAIQTNNN